MAINYYEINDVVDPLDAGMSLVVSDKATEDGTGMAPIADVLRKFTAYGGMNVLSTAAVLPSVALAAGVPQTIIGWEASMPANKDVTIDIVNGLITVVDTGAYEVKCGLSIEHNVTTDVLVELVKNGTTVIADTLIAFKNNTVDKESMPLFHMDDYIAGDTLELQWTSVAGGTITLNSGQASLHNL